MLQVTHNGLSRRNVRKAVQSSLQPLSLNDESSSVIELQPDRSYFKCVRKDLAGVFDSAHHQNMVAPILAQCQYAKFENVELELLDYAYLPSWTGLTPEVDLTNPLWTRPFPDLPKGAWFATSFEVSGMGQYKLQLYPQGVEQAEDGRCSVMLWGPNDVELKFILQIGGIVFGNLSTPIHCNNAAIGCLVEDAGSAFRLEDRQIVTVWMVSAQLNVATDIDHL